MALRDNALNIFADGSSLSRPRRGGIGVRFVTTDAAGDEVIDDHCLPGYLDGTNNQMELMACITALEMASDDSMLKDLTEVWVFTDSMYVTENLSNAKFVWPKCKWMKQGGAPVENAELWKDLVRAIKQLPRPVRVEWVKGHSKNVHNRAADKLARQSANGVLNKSLRATTVRRKKTDRSVEVGSVKMEGQTMSVRIITDTYLRPQRLYKYMYEVLTESSAYRGNCDYIFSDLVLRAGHHYEVRVNDASSNPRIVAVLNELDRHTGDVLVEQHDSAEREG